MTIAASALNRLEHIQALRGLAALMVMLSHLYSIDQKYSAAPVLPESLLLGFAGVDMFFVISGFIIVYITNAWTGPSIKWVPEFLFARITRIYPLYWLVSAILLVIYVIRPDMVFSSSHGEPNLIKSFMLLPDNTFPLLEVGWTLIHEMGFYIVFAGLLILPKTYRVWGLFIWAAIIMAASILNLNESSNLARYALSALSLEFIAGGVIGWLFLKGVAQKTSWVLPMTALSIFGSVGAYYAFGAADIFNAHWQRTLIFTVPASLAVLLLAMRDQSNKACPKMLVTLGDWSYALYLTHILTLSLMGRFWAQLDIQNQFFNVIALIAMSVTAIVISGLTYKLFERPALLLSKWIRQTIFN